MESETRIACRRWKSPTYIYNLAISITVAILAQGTSRAAAVSQAFWMPVGSIPAPIADDIQVAGAKADSTLRASRAVPHPSTDRALRRLTSEVRRDPVHSTRYGRQRHCRRVSGVELLRARPGPTEPDTGLRRRSSPTCTLSQNGYGA